MDIPLIPIFLLRFEPTAHWMEEGWHCLGKMQKLNSPKSLMQLCKNTKLIRFWSTLQKFVFINTFDVAGFCLILINSKYLEYLFQHHQVHVYQQFDPYYIDIYDTQF